MGKRIFRSPIGGLHKGTRDATPEEQTELNEYLLNSNIDKNLLLQVNCFGDMPLHSKNAPSEEDLQLKGNKLHRKIKNTQEKTNEIAERSGIID